MRVLLVLLLALTAGIASARTIDEDVDYYLKVLDMETRAQARQLEHLSGMGLSDPRLFDVIEKRVLEQHDAARGDREERGRVAWYIRALGFSGSVKYEATLQKFTDDRGYRSYAISALNDLVAYGRWNPVISDRAGFQPGLSDDSNRVLNMLRAEDDGLMRLGAKRAYFLRTADKPVLEVLARRLRERYRVEDAEGADTVAWFVKALATNAPGEYDDLLAEVRDNAPERKVRNQAAAMLRRR